MATELEKPRITEVQVRMDCNGCVQKIKKALHGINGIYEVYIDFPHQKIRIVGRADPEKIVKAIKKTRKSAAVICSHTEQQPKPSEQPPPPPDEAEETAKAIDPDPPMAPENQPADEEKQSPETAEMQTADQTSKPKEDNVHVIYHYPPHYGYTQQWNNSQPPRAEPPPPPPMYVSHSYNSYKPSPHVTRRYDQYVDSSPPTYTQYGRPDGHYYTMMAEDYYHYRDDEYHNNGNIDSVFSEENPNSCTIV
ncbi:PREDICTED: heavy metal-associated isoprenylated plant protein 36-like isoform X4 [Ipomoea nil]|uniref:heavy metal-associated isoprenylated plant protein 36-like isoform X4 n=1 Tax=Ipomoea nil TaxID=35883 RepID=UPI00090186F9|nr:PREDICTED: heavy metal-associated isoprenylated plant protein 36-like isoform X4 [Ipomoea nil]